MIRPSTRTPAALLARRRHASTVASPQKKSGPAWFKAASSGSSASERAPTAQEIIAAGLIKKNESRSASGGTVDSTSIKYEPLEVKDQPEVPPLAHNLDRVLFSPGVHFLKDPRTQVYNFTPHLENIMSIRDFDFNKIAQYVPSGKDSRLAQLAGERHQKYVGSTSSLTGILGKFHHVLSGFRPPMIQDLSKNFPGLTTTFAKSQLRPVSIFLRHNPKTKTWAIDADKAEDSDMILSILGHALETMLTTPSKEFLNYHKDLSHNLKDNEAQHTYNYTSCGNVLMRSQLDCFDERLPGTGMFDLKTRAACAVRHDLDYVQVHDGTDYTIKQLYGQYESFEREWMELIRSQMFKYSLQARIGRMDGIFIAYHNVRRMFGFQYVPLSQMDQIFHSITNDNEGMKDKLDPKFTNEDASATADAEFTLSVQLMERILDKILQDLGEHVNANVVVNAAGPGRMTVFVKPMTEKHIKYIQNNSKEPDSRVVKGDSNEYKAKKDPFTIWKHAETHPDVVPKDVKVYVIDFRNTVGGERLKRAQYPMVKTLDNSSWQVDYKVRQLSQTDSRNRLNLFQACFRDKPYILREITSSPQTERLDENDEVRQRQAALKLLQPPTDLQKKLRQIAKQGSDYQKLSETKEKVIWSPRHDQQTQK